MSPPLTPNPSKELTGVSRVEHLPPRSYPRATERIGKSIQSQGASSGNRPIQGRSGTTVEVDGEEDGRSTVYVLHIPVRLLVPQTSQSEGVMDTTSSLRDGPPVYVSLTGPPDPSTPVPTWGRLLGSVGPGPPREVVGTGGVTATPVTRPPPTPPVTVLVRGRRRRERHPTSRSEGP